jgi:regulator of sigma E protease
LHYLAIIPILGILMVAHELGHFITARLTGIVVEEFAIGFPPRILTIVRNGIRYSLNLLPLGAYVKMLGEEDPTDPGSFAAQSKKVRILVLAAGSTMNLLVAILAFSLAFAFGAPDGSKVEIRIREVMAGSPAEASGLRAGDYIREIDGQAFSTVPSFQEAVRSRQGQPSTLRIDRDGQPTTINITPRFVTQENPGALGVTLDPIAVPSLHGPVESLQFGVKRTFDVVGLTFSVPALLIRGDIAPADARPTALPGMTQVAADATAHAVSTGWLYPIFMVAGFFSAGLAVANMLPIPALDGGRIVFVVIEAVRGRRISPEREGLIHLVGMAALLALMVVISVNDLTSPLPSIPWGPR